MAEKMRDNDKSRKVFTSKQKSNKERGDYYDAMHKNDLRMQENNLNPISFTKINNMDNLYYHKAMKAPGATSFQKSIIKKFNSHIEKNQW